jgi:hypothetical protein
LAALGRPIRVLPFKVRGKVRKKIKGGELERSIQVLEAAHLEI